MSKSLEALERIETVFHCNKQGKKNCYAHFMSPSKAIEEYYKDYNIIKQDLERKEQLEKENQELIVNKNVAQAVAFDQKREIGELKDQIAYLKEDGEEWQSAYEWSQAQNSILKLKNQELEEENQKLKKEYNLLDTTMESDDRIICEILKENEQLKNDIKLNEAQIKDLTLEVANYKHALEEKNEIIMDLKEENKELLVNKNLAQAIALKYKKTIEILKDKRVNIDLLLNSSECPTYNFYAKQQDLEDLNQQEYELLKEVLKLFK